MGSPTAGSKLKPCCGILYFWSVVFAVMFAAVALTSVVTHSLVGQPARKWTDPPPTCTRPDAIPASSLGEEPEPSPMPYTTGKKVISTIATLGVPIIEEAALGNVFHPSKVSGVEINDMRLETFAMKSIKVTLAAPSAQNITVDIVDLRLTIPDTKFIFTYGILTCPGVFRLSLNETKLRFNVLPYREDEYMRVAVGPEATNISWGTMTFEHDLDRWFCRIGQSIVQLFKGQLDEMVENSIKEQLPLMLPKNLEEQSNKALRDSGIRFTQPLALTKDRATGQIEMIPHQKAPTTPTTTTSTEAPEKVSLARGDSSSSSSSGLQVPNKDLGVVLYRDSINALLRHAVRADWLRYAVMLPPEIDTADIEAVFPDAVALCPNCTLGFGLAAATAAPQVTFRASDLAVSARVVELQVGLFLLPRTAAEYEATVARLKGRAERSDAGRITGSFAAFNGLSFQPFRRWPAPPTAAAPSSSAVPVVAFSVNFTLEVSNIAARGDRHNIIHFAIHPIGDLSMELVASSMGPVDAAGYTRDFNVALNDFVIPMLNLESPYDPPGLIKDILFAIEDQHITAGFNISLF